MIKCRLKGVLVLLAMTLFFTGFIGSYTDHAYALDNGLAKTPPMGWNSWNHFRCYDINEQVIKETADAMVESGMKEAGYEYIVIDDCWQAFSRDENGNLQANPDRFPNGIQALADYVHERGLKLGIYSVPGSETCAMYWDDYPAEGIGSYGHVEQDAKQFAEWGIDYLKYDWCRADETNGLKRISAFKKMRNALEETGRPIAYSISEYGNKKPWEWAQPIANMWRTTSDISPNWGSLMHILDEQVGLYKYASPGNWNDPDMLQVGNPGLSETENQAHFSIWSMLAAPLMAGNDLRHMSESTLEILTNKEVIAVDQDPIGIQGRKISDKGDHEVWLRPLANGDRAVILPNRGENNAEISVNVTELGLPNPDKSYKIRDLWAHTTSQTKGTVQASVPGHGVKMFRISPDYSYEGSEKISKVHTNEDQEVWVQPLKDGGKLVTFVNRGGKPADISINAEELNLKHASAYIVENIWDHSKKAVAETIMESVQPYSVSVVKVVRGKPGDAPPAINMSLKSPKQMEPGETEKIIATIANSGAAAANNVQVSLDVPEGWTVEPDSDTSFDTIHPKSNVQAAWKVTVPKDFAPGSVNFNSETIIEYGDEGEHASYQARATTEITPAPPTTDTYVSDLPYYKNHINGWGPAERDMSVGGSNSDDGNTLTINGETFEKGLGTNSYSEIVYYVGGNFSRFQSAIGIDDEVQWEDGEKGDVVFQVWGDSTKLYDSGLVTGKTETKYIDLDITGVNVLKLVVTDGGDNNWFDHADWAGAKIIVNDDTDRTPPEVNTLMNGESLQNDVTVPDTKSVKFTWDATDAKSGIARLTTKFDGEAYKEDTAIDLAGKPGKHELVVKAVDKAGNVKEKAYVINVTTSVANMEKHVEQFKESGAFTNDRAARAVHLHLIAVNRYEEIGSVEKAVKHMKGFKVILNQQKENELISEKAYNVLKADADYLINKWQ